MAGRILAERRAEAVLSQTELDEIRCRRIVVLGTSAYLLAAAVALIVCIRA